MTDSYTIAGQRQALFDTWTGERTVDELYDDVRTDVFTGLMTRAIRHGAIDDDSETVYLGVNDITDEWLGIDEEYGTGRLEQYYKKTPFYDRGFEQYNKQDGSDGDIEALMEEYANDGVPMLKERMMGILGMAGGLAGALYGVMTGNDAVFWAGNSIFLAGTAGTHAARAYGIGAQDGFEKTMEEPLAQEIRSDIGTYTIDVHNTNLGTFLEEEWKEMENQEY